MVLAVNNLTGFGGGGQSTVTIGEVTSGTGTGTTMAVTLPTVLTGRLVVVITAVNGSTENPTSPSGWTVFFLNNATASGDEWHGWYKICDGTEGSTLNITKSSTNFYSYLCFSGINATLADGNLPNDETSSTPTPSIYNPAYAPSAIVTLLTCDQATINAYPSTNPEANTVTTGGSSSQPMIAMAVAYRSPSNGSFSPGDWTLATSEACTMRTFGMANSVF